ncbi:histone-fold-containing protein, partial [Tilletiaria anomala UBC 951]
RSTAGTTALPIARVARIIKADQEIDTTSKESVFLIAAATEIFIKHLSDQAYANARLEKRKVVHYKDLQRAIQRDWTLDFLKEIVPMSMPLSAALAKRQFKLEDNLKNDAGVMDSGSDEGQEDGKDDAASE